jgi:putative protease
VGQEIEKYIKAGVVSFKIEGRMRRAEYVAAATRYYRALLDGNANTQGALSDLKRAYNRGNYTKGLAFGQDKRFLSPLVQGHMGEKVGVVKVTNGQYFVSSSFQPTQGDAFKILRGGTEIGGAIFLKQERKGFFVSAKSRLKNGDDVFITTDNVMSKRVLSAKKTGELTLELCFEEGKRPLIKCAETVVRGDGILQTAQNRPLTKEDLKSCFLKTDGLPAEIRFERIDLIGNIFLPKSELNALRRSFYQAVSAKISNGD